MGPESHAAEPRFERVTVYVDLAAEVELLPVITACARRLGSECNIISHKDFAKVHPSADAASPPPSATRTHTTIALIRLWQAEEADVYTRDVNNTVNFMNATELLITDKNSADGAVTYALYQRQMHVLSLARTHLPARTLLHQVLYTEAPDASVATQTAAIQRFLTFPEARGGYVVNASPKLTAAAAAKNGKASFATVVRVDADGYPIQLLRGEGCDAAANDDESPTLLPPPPTLFANLVAELRSSSSPHLDVLRRRNPLLPGVLAAFHRFQNRGIVRAMLHRGYRVEVADTAAAESLAWVRTFIALTEPSEEGQAESTAAAAASTLAKFESHWLELPLAQRQTS